MKNLYKRLKPEILVSINEDRQKYPFTTRALKLKLKSTYDWSELSIGNVHSIINHSHVNLVDICQTDLLWGDKFLIK
tara:strand:- start:461 stop:691 length:231 start_codon:yes stop_codon:yes gene_type:complete